MSTQIFKPFAEIAKEAAESVYPPEQREKDQREITVKQNIARWKREHRKTHFGWIERKTNLPLAW